MNILPLKIFGFFVFILLNLWCSTWRLNIWQLMTNRCCLKPVFLIGVWGSTRSGHATIFDWYLCLLGRCLRASNGLRSPATRSIAISIPYRLFFINVIHYMTRPYLYIHHAAYSLPYIQYTLIIITHGFICTTLYSFPQ